MSRNFTSVDDKVLQQVIPKARKRPVFVVPGIRPPAAEALIQALDVVPKNAINLVLDVDAKVCRRGYPLVNSRRLQPRARRIRCLRFAQGYL